MSLVALQHLATGHHTQCSRCGADDPEYRISVANYLRFLCERCMILIALEDAA